MQSAFDSWDVEAVPIPARSRLHSIEPIGVGTPFVESLTGYIIRLAASHAVRKRLGRTRTSGEHSVFSRASRHS